MIRRREAGSAAMHARADGSVREPRSTSQMLTRRLITSASIDSGDAGSAMATARSVRVSQRYGPGPEDRRAGIHHTDATPAG